MMRHLVVVLGLGLGLGLVAGCAGGLNGAEGPQCEVGLSFSPTSPVAGPTSEIRVSSFVTDADGVRTYDWSVSHAGAAIAFEAAQADGSQITFPALTAGTYEVSLGVSVSSGPCPQAFATINVTTGGTMFGVRLHVTPPPGVDAPPIDRLLQIPIDADYELGPVVLDPGSVLAGTVRAAGVGVPAYLQFRPLGMSDAVVEAYAAADGTFSARLLNQLHEVVVIPSGSTLAPTRLMWMPGSTTLTVDAGMAITGVVRNPAGNGLANAKVQLTIGGVPSTLATTTGTGAFTVRGVPITGADVKVAVTPPAGSGLPRLEATGAFSLSTPFDVSYNANLVVRNLGGTEVRRGGAPVANARVTVVGALAAVGSVTAGATASATGFVRIAASTSGSGVLPTMFVLAAPLSAVVAIPPGDPLQAPSDHAVDEINLTTTVPPVIDASSMVAFTADARIGAFSLPGARLDLVPAGALALAGVPGRSFTADVTGAVTGSVVAGGSYDARWSDPAGGAGAKLFPGRTSATLTGAFDLPPALVVSGTLSITGNSNKIVGAAVEMRCDGCSGIDRDRPIAEAASDQFGQFELAISNGDTR